MTKGDSESAPTDLLRACCSNQLATSQKLQEEKAKVPHHDFSTSIRSLIHPRSAMALCLPVACAVRDSQSVLLILSVNEADARIQTKISN